MQVLPALLTASAVELKGQISMLSPYYTHFQIDIADGIFVPNKTVGIDSLFETLKDYKNSPLSFDFDLMVEDYKQSFELLKDLANMITIENVFFHFSSLKESPLPVLSKFTIGIALDPKDDFSDLEHNYDMNSGFPIQIMTVNPGFQGSPFIENELYKIEQIKSANYKNNIFIDGGINEKTIPIILSKKYRPDFMGIGSYLTKAPDLPGRVEKLRQLIK